MTFWRSLHLVFTGLLFSSLFFDMWPSRLRLKNTLNTSLHRGKKQHQRVSCIWYKAIWWWGSSNAETLGNLEYPWLPSLPGPLGPGVVALDRVPSMGQIELNCVIMLNWTALNRTVLTFKLCTYAKLNCLKCNCFVC